MTIEELRDRAEEMRVIAGLMHDETRAILTRCSDSYQRMAEMLEDNDDDADER